ILELITNFKKFSDISFESAIPKMRNYVKDIEIELNEIMHYLDLYPRARKEFIEGGLLNEIAQRRKSF
ncbi:hypothetical protein, partial [Bacillus wiedmannii]|uniref:hypothetical protein n=1 Tax=Bacillus wiedmannii TaxID=1890302 RepID=UPI001C54FD5C